MNVTETIKQILSECIIMDSFNDGIHIDYTDSETKDIGMYPVGPTKSGEDIIGNTKYNIKFEIYSKLTAYEDYERLKNSNFLTMLTYYLNKKRHISVTEKVITDDLQEEMEIQGEILSIDAGNALLFSLPTGDINDGVMYQLQLTVAYKLYTA